MGAIMGAILENWLDFHLPENFLAGSAVEERFGLITTAKETENDNH
jgi:hypothetical protein